MGQSTFFPCRDLPGTRATAATQLPLDGRLEAGRPECLLPLYVLANGAELLVRHCLCNERRVRLSALACSAAKCQQRGV